MNDDIFQEVKRRVGAFLQSPDFDEHFERLHSLSRPVLIASWFLMPFLLQGEASKGAWHKLSCGDIRSSRLRRRYARLAEVGEVIFTYVLVCNAGLKRQPGINAPALVIGNFNGGRDAAALLKLREKLAKLPHGIDIERRDRKVAKLLSGFDYCFQRRRHLPISYTGGVQVTAFDLMILGDFLPTETLQIEAIPCIAEPGKRGLIAMIPHFLIEDVISRISSAPCTPIAKAMFGLFKKRQPEPPPLPSQNLQFQTFFATKWVHSALTSSIAGFSGAVLCGDGSKVITNSWKKMWASNFPNEPLMPPDGLAVDGFRESDLFLVFITFPPPAASGGAYFGIVVLGPCEDPNWGPEGRQNLPFRYFVLFRAATGTTVEEWTTDPPVQLGNGPEPQRPFFAEWVLNHAVRSAENTTVIVRSDTEDVAAAIARARRELPVVLQRFLAGELPDSGFTVKVPIKDGEFREHFWLSDTTFADGQFSGVIDADPQSVSTVKRGDRWTAPVADVTDWMYTRNKKMHGNYTLRALLPKMPPHEAAKYRAVLADEVA